MERVGSFGTPSQVLGELSKKLDALDSGSLTADERRDLVAMQREIRELLDVYADDEAAAPHLRRAYERVSILLSRPSPGPPLLFLTNEAANAIPEFLFDPGLHLRQHSLRAAVAPPEFSAADRAAGRPPSMSMCFVGDPFGTGPLLIQDSPTAIEYAASQTSFEPPVAAGSAALPRPPEGEVPHASSVSAADTTTFATPSIAIVPRAQSDVAFEPLSLARLRAEPTAALVSIVEAGAQALVQLHAPMLELQRALLPVWRAALSSGISVPAATPDDVDLPPESVVAAIAQRRAATVLGHRGMRQAGNDEALKLGAVQALTTLAKSTSAPPAAGCTEAERRLWADVNTAACTAVVRLLQYSSEPDRLVLYGPSPRSPIPTFVPPPSPIPMPRSQSAAHVFPPPPPPPSVPASRGASDASATSTSSADVPGRPRFPTTPPPHVVASPSPTVTPPPARVASPSAVSAGSAASVAQPDSQPPQPSAPPALPPVDIEGVLLCLSVVHSRATMGLGAALVARRRDSDELLAEDRTPPSGATMALPPACPPELGRALSAESASSGEGGGGAIGNDTVSKLLGCDGHLALGVAQSLFNLCSDAKFLSGQAMGDLAQFVLAFIPQARGGHFVPVALPPPPPPPAAARAAVTVKSTALTTPKANRRLPASAQATPGGAAAGAAATARVKSTASAALPPEIPMTPAETDLVVERFRCAMASGFFDVNGFGERALGLLLRILDPSSQFPPLPRSHSATAQAVASSGSGTPTLVPPAPQQQRLEPEWGAHALSWKEAKRKSLVALHELAVASEQVRRSAAEAALLVATSDATSSRRGGRLGLPPDGVRAFLGCLRIVAPLVDLRARMIEEGAISHVKAILSSAPPVSSGGVDAEWQQRCALGIVKLCLAPLPSPVALCTLGYTGRRTAALPAAPAATRVSVPSDGHPAGEVSASKSFPGTTQRRGRAPPPIRAHSGESNAPPLETPRDSPASGGSDGGGDCGGGSVVVMGTPRTSPNVLNTPASVPGLPGRPQLFFRGGSSSRILASPAAVVTRRSPRMGTMLPPIECSADSNDDASPAPSSAPFDGPQTEGSARLVEPSPGVAPDPPGGLLVPRGSAAPPFVSTARPPIYSPPLSRVGSRSRSINEMSPIVLLRQGSACSGIASSGRRGSAGSSGSTSPTGSAAAASGIDTAAGAPPAPLTVRLSARSTSCPPSTVTAPDVADDGDPETDERRLAMKTTSPRRRPSSDEAFSTSLDAACSAESVWEACVSKVAASGIVEALRDRVFEGNDGSQGGAGPGVLPAHLRLPEPPIHIRSSEAGAYRLEALELLVAVTARCSSASRRLLVERGAVSIFSAVVLWNLERYCSLEVGEERRRRVAEKATRAHARALAHARAERKRSQLEAAEAASSSASPGKQGSVSEGEDGRPRRMQAAHTGTSEHAAGVLKSSSAHPIGSAPHAKGPFALPLPLSRYPSALVRDDFEHVPPALAVVGRGHSAPQTLGTPPTGALLNSPTNAFPIGQAADQALRPSLPVDISALAVELAAAFGSPVGLPLLSPESLRRIASINVAAMTQSVPPTVPPARVRPHSMSLSSPPFDISAIAPMGARSPWRYRQREGSTDVEAFPATSDRATAFKSTLRSSSYGASPLPPLPPPPPPAAFPRLLRNSKSADAASEEAAFLGSFSGTNTLPLPPPVIRISALAPSQPPPAVIIPPPPFVPLDVPIMDGALVTAVSALVSLWNSLAESGIDTAESDIPCKAEQRDAPSAFVLDGGISALLAVVHHLSARYNAPAAACRPFFREVPTIFVSVLPVIRAAVVARPAVAVQVASSIATIESVSNLLRLIGPGYPTELVVVGAAAAADDTTARPAPPSHPRRGAAAADSSSRSHSMRAKDANMRRSNTSAAESHAADHDVASGTGVQMQKCQAEHAAVPQTVAAATNSQGGAESPRIAVLWGLSDDQSFSVREHLFAILAALVSQPTLHRALITGEGNSAMPTPFTWRRRLLETLLSYQLVTSTVLACASGATVTSRHALRTLVGMCRLCVSRCAAAHLGNSHLTTPASTHLHSAAAAPAANDHRADDLWAGLPCLCCSLEMMPLGTAITLAQSVLCESRFDCVGTNVLLADVAPAAQVPDGPAADWIVTTEAADSSPAPARAAVASVPASMEHPRLPAAAGVQYPPAPSKAPLLRSQSLPTDVTSVRPVPSHAHNATIGVPSEKLRIPGPPIPAVARGPSEASQPLPAVQVVYGNALQRLQTAGHGEPVTAHFVPFAVLSPGLCMLLPPARFGIAPLLLSAMATADMESTEAAVEGLRLLLPTSSTVLALSRYALPLLVAIAADASAPDALARHARQLLVSLSCDGPLQPPHASAASHSPTSSHHVGAFALLQWQARWSALASRRELFRRHVSQCRAWESPAEHKKWKKFRSKNARLGSSAGALWEVMRASGLELPSWQSLAAASDLGASQFSVLALARDVQLQRASSEGGAPLRDLNRLRLAALCAAAQRCLHIETILMGIVDAGVCGMENGLHVRARLPRRVVTGARNRNGSTGSASRPTQQRHPHSDSAHVTLQARDLRKNGGFIAAALARTLSAALSAQLLRLYRPAILAAPIRYDTIREVTSRGGRFHEGKLGDKTIYTRLMDHRDDMTVADEDSVYSAAQHSTAFAPTPHETTVTGFATAFGRAAVDAARYFVGGSEQPRPPPIQHQSSTGGFYPDPPQGSSGTRPPPTPDEHFAALFFNGPHQPVTLMRQSSGALSVMAGYDSGINSDDAEGLATSPAHRGVHHADARESRAPSVHAGPVGVGPVAPNATRATGGGADDRRRRPTLERMVSAPLETQPYLDVSTDAAFGGAAGVPPTPHNGWGGINGRSIGRPPAPVSAGPSVVKFFAPFANILGVGPTAPKQPDKAPSPPHIAPARPGAAASTLSTNAYFNTGTSIVADYYSLMRESEGGADSPAPYGFLAEYVWLWGLLSVVAERAVRSASEATWANDVRADNNPPAPYMRGVIAEAAAAASAAKSAAAVRARRDASMAGLPYHPLSAIVLTPDEIAQPEMALAVGVRNLQFTHFLPLEVSALVRGHVARRQVASDAPVLHTAPPPRRYPQADDSSMAVAALSHHGSRPVSVSDAPVVGSDVASGAISSSTCSRSSNTSSIPSGGHYSEDEDVDFEAPRTATPPRRRHDDDLISRRHRHETPISAASPALKAARRGLRRQYGRHCISVDAQDYWRDRGGAVSSLVSASYRLSVSSGIQTGDVRLAHCVVEHADHRLVSSRGLASLLEFGRQLPARIASDKAAVIAAAASPIDGQESDDNSADESPRADGRRAGRRDAAPSYGTLGGPRKLIPDNEGRSFDEAVGMRGARHGSGSVSRSHGDGSDSADSDDFDQDDDADHHAAYDMRRRRDAHDTMGRSRGRRGGLGGFSAVSEDDVAYDGALPLAMVAGRNVVQDDPNAVDQALDLPAADASAAAASAAQGGTWQESDAPTDAPAEHEYEALDYDADEYPYAQACVGWPVPSGQYERGTAALHFANAAVFPFRPDALDGLPRWGPRGGQPGAARGTAIAEAPPKVASGPNIPRHGRGTHASAPLMDRASASAESPADAADSTGCPPFLDDGSPLAPLDAYVAELIAILGAAPHVWNDAAATAASESALQPAAAVSPHALPHPLAGAPYATRGPHVTAAVVLPPCLSPIDLSSDAMVTARGTGSCGGAAALVRSPFERQSATSPLVGPVRSTAADVPALDAFRTAPPLSSITIPAAWVQRAVETAAAAVNRLQSDSLSPRFVGTSPRPADSRLLRIGLAAGHRLRLLVASELSRSQPSGSALVGSLTLTGAAEGHLRETRPHVNTDPWVAYTHDFPMLISMSSLLATLPSSVHTLTVSGGFAATEWHIAAVVGALQSLWIDVRARIDQQQPSLHDHDAGQAHTTLESTANESPSGAPGSSAAATAHPLRSRYTPGLGYTGVTGLAITDHGSVLGRVQLRPILRLLLDPFGDLPGETARQSTDVALQGAPSGSDVASDRAAAGPEFQRSTPANQAYPGIVRLPFPPDSGSPSSARSPYASWGRGLRSPDFPGGGRVDTGGSATHGAKGGTSCDANKDSPPRAARPPDTSVGPDDAVFSDTDSDNGDTGESGSPDARRQTSAFGTSPVGSLFEDPQVPPAHVDNVLQLMDPRSLAAACELGLEAAPPFIVLTAAPPFAQTTAVGDSSALRNAATPAVSGSATLPLELTAPLPFIGLRWLDLSGNNLGDDGAADIVDALCSPFSPSQLAFLGLAANRIVGGENLCEALTRTGERPGLFYTNATLRGLSLASNPLAEPCVAQILKVLADAHGDGERWAWPKASKPVASCEADTTAPVAAPQGVRRGSAATAGDPGQTDGAFILPLPGRTVVRPMALRKPRHPTLRQPRPDRKYRPLVRVLLGVTGVSRRAVAPATMREAVAGHASEKQASPAEPRLSMSVGDVGADDDGGLRAASASLASICQPAGLLPASLVRSADSTQSPPLTGAGYSAPSPSRSALDASPQSASERRVVGTATAAALAAAASSSTASAPSGPAAPGGGSGSAGNGTSKPPVENASGVDVYAIAEAAIDVAKAIEARRLIESSVRQVRSGIAMVGNTRFQQQRAVSAAAPASANTKRPLTVGAILDGGGSGSGAHRGSFAAATTSSSSGAAGGGGGFLGRMLHRAAATAAAVAGVVSDGVAKAAAAVAPPVASVPASATQSSPREAAPAPAAAPEHAAPVRPGGSHGKRSQAAKSAAASSARSYKAPAPVTRLSYLNLAACGLHSSQLTTALVKCIETNSTLREIDVSGNMLSSEAGSRLLHAVVFYVRKHAHRHRLWFLRLAGNPLLRQRDRRDISGQLRRYRAKWAEDRAPPPPPLPPLLLPAAAAAGSGRSGLRTNSASGTPDDSDSGATPAGPPPRRQSHEDAVTAGTGVGRRASVATADAARGISGAAPAPPSDAYDKDSASAATTSRGLTGTDGSSTDLTDDKSKSPPPRTLRPPPPLSAVGDKHAADSPEESVAVAAAIAQSLGRLESIAGSAGQAPTVLALFASPLAYHIPDGQGGTILVPMAPLKFGEERRLLSRALAEGAENGRRHRFTGARQLSSGSLDGASLPSARDHTAALVATIERLTSQCLPPKLRCRFLSVHSLRAAIMEDVDVLHLSLHGEHAHLALEHPDGTCYPLTVPALTALLDAGGGGGILRPDGTPRVRLVVLAACKSHWAAELLVAAGVPHVVCVEPTVDVLDHTCLVFVQAFYHALASLETVRAAFSTARATAMLGAPVAVPTFLLLPDGSPEHDRPFFGGGAGGGSSGSARRLGRASSSVSLASEAAAAQCASLDPQGMAPTPLIFPLPSTGGDRPSAAVPPPPLRTSRSHDTAEDPSPMLTDATPALAPRRGAAAFASVFPDVILPPSAAAALAPPAPAAATPFASGSLYAYSRPDSDHYAGVRDDGGDDFTSLVESLPRMPEHFVGRSIAMAKIVADCQFSRMITIFGPQGSGKSALAVAVAHWFALRQGGHEDANLGGCAFPGGVIYVDVRAALDAWGHAPPGEGPSGRRRGAAAAAPTPVPVSAAVAPWMSPVSSGSVTPAALRSRAAPRCEVSPREAVILGLFRAACPGEWDTECAALRARLRAASAVPPTPVSAATSPLSRSAEISKRRRGKTPAGAGGSSSLADFHPPLPRQQQRGPQQQPTRQEQPPPPPRAHHTRRGRRLSDSLREGTSTGSGAAAAAAGADGLPWPPAAGPQAKGSSRPRDRHLLRAASGASIVAQDTATEASDSAAAPSSGRGRSKGGRGGGGRSKGGGDRPSHKRVPAPWSGVAATGESGTEEDSEVPFAAAAGPRGRWAAEARGAEAPAAPPPPPPPGVRPIDADRLLARVIERLRPLRCLLVLDNLDCEGDGEGGGGGDAAPQPRQQGGWGLAAPPQEPQQQQSQLLWQQAQQAAQAQAAAYHPYGHALGLQYAPSTPAPSAAAAPAAAVYPYAQGLVYGAPLPAPAFTSALWPDAAAAAAAVTPGPPVGFGSFDAGSVGDMLAASYFALATGGAASVADAGPQGAALGSPLVTPASPDSVLRAPTNDDVAAPLALPPSAATDDDDASSSADPWGPLAPITSAWVKSALLRHLVVGPHHLHVVVTRRQPLGRFDAFAAFPHSVQHKVHPLTTDDAATLFGLLQGASSTDWDMSSARGVVRSRGCFPRDVIAAAREASSLLQEASARPPPPLPGGGGWPGWT